MCYLFSLFSLDAVETLPKHCIVHYSGYDNYSKIKHAPEITH